MGYHCAIEFPCGVLLFYCCKYPTTYGVRVHILHMALVGYLIVFSFVTKCGQTIEFPLWGTIVPLNFPCGVPLFHWISLWGTIVLLLQVPHNLWRTRPHSFVYGVNQVSPIVHLYCDSNRGRIVLHCDINRGRVSMSQNIYELVQLGNIQLNLKTITVLRGVHYWLLIPAKINNQRELY